MAEPPRIFAESPLPRMKKHAISDASGLTVFAISYCASRQVPRHLRGSASDDGRQYVQHSRLVIIEDLQLKIQ